MDLPDLSYRQGETLQLGFEGDDDAETVTIIVKATDDAANPSLIESASFVGGEATIDTPVDIADGSYIYQITYTYTDGTIEKYPSTVDCEGECEFPAFVVCVALDPGVS